VGGEGDNESFCCFGCRFAAAVTQARGEQGASVWALTRLGLAIFFTMNVMVFTMALWTGVESAGGATLVLRGLFRHLCLLFALPVLFLLGGPLLDNALHDLRHGRLSTDLLLLVGVAASYLYSAVAVLREQGPIYFEVGCMVLVLVTFGRWLEATGKLRTGAAIESLARLLPDTVRRIEDAEVEVPLAEVRSGDRLRIRPGERIPCDGVVEHGRAAIDEQVLTGESDSVVREPGDAVLAGTLNLDGDLQIRATAPAGAGALERLIQLVRAAREAKGPYEQLADRIAARFLPAVVLIALGAAAYHGSQSGVAPGILAGLAVLLIACPCALGLATPMAVWAALGQAARAQVLFRNGEALERLAGIRALLLDKTGTVTTGTPRVAEFVAAAAREEVLARAAQLAAASTHGHSAAIVRFAGQVPTAPIEVRALPGRGLAARLPAGDEVFLGSLRLMQENSLIVPPSLTAMVERARQGEQPLACIGWEGEIRGLFLLEEQVRPEAEAALARLRAQGLAVALLTGDHAARGQAIGRQLGIAVQAELLPADKAAAVEQVQRTYGVVAMVGDGINDAPALARSDVGVAMGCGADVARDSAQVCLLGNDLRRLPWAIDLARRTARVIRTNLFWAFVYNIVGIGLACTGRLNPVLAALAMVMSSLLVVANSLRLASAGGGAALS
jgi:heavy metal translocating P-type ATPase